MFCGTLPRMPVKNVQQQVRQSTPQYARPLSVAQTSRASYAKPSGQAGPSVSRGSGVATVLTLGVVGGMFLWLTKGPRMAARSNPRGEWPWV